jgi:thioesterase DpgC
VNNSGWPRKPLRDTAQGTGAATVKTILRAVRNAFARTYSERIYSKITNGYRSFVRVEELVYRAAELCPGLCPTKEEVEAELRLPLSDKEGTEIAWEIFLLVLSYKSVATSRTMLRLRESRELLASPETGGWTRIPRKRAPRTAKCLSNNRATQRRG